MKKVELYNKIMSGLSNIVHQHLNESMRKVKYAQYSEIYSPEEQNEIEKMLMRVDLLDPSYIHEYQYTNRNTQKTETAFEIVNLEKMTVDELSKFIANISWTHTFLSYDVDISEIDLNKADIVIPHVDNCLSICYDVEFECIPGDSGDYYTPPSPGEINVDSFEITEAYIEIDKNNVVKLNLDVVNEKGQKLLDVLYDICSTYIDDDTLAEMYENGRYDDYDDGYYDD